MLKKKLRQFALQMQLHLQVVDYTIGGIMNPYKESYLELMKKLKLENGTRIYGRTIAILNLESLDWGE